MFTITVMPHGSEDYYFKQCSYYGLGRGKTKKRSKGDPADDESPDLDPDGVAPGFDNAEEHSIYLPGEQPGMWDGGAAPYFNLSGIIQEEDYRRIYHGFHPHTGEPLVQNAGKPNRRPGFECCVSALKDFSILAFAVPRKWRKRFLKVFWKVVKDVLRMIEERFAFSRVGKAKNGCRYVPVKILAALWQHCSSRSLDEDLHIHIQLFNLGVDAEGKVRALDPLQIFRNQRLITAYGLAKLSAEIKQQFGLIVEADGNTYRIRGMPKDLVKEKSKRRQEILAYMAERGQSGGKDAFWAAKRTRSAKDYGISLAELMEKWRATNIAAGLDDAAIARLLRNAREEPDDDELPEEDQADETPVVENVERTSPVVECDNAASIDIPPDTPEQSFDGKLPTEDQSEGPQEVLETAPQVVEEAPTGLLPETPQDLSDEYITSDFPIGEPPIAESVGSSSPTTTCIGGEASASADTQPGQAASRQEPASYASWGSNYSSEKVGRRSTHRRMREWKKPPFPTDFGPVSYPPGRYSLSQQMALNRKEVIPKRKNARRISSVSKKLIRKAIVRATRRRNHFSQRELLYYTLYHLPRYGIDPRPVFEEVDHFLLHSSRIVPLGNDQDGEMRFTTKLILENERRLLAAFERMAKRPGRRVSDKKLRKTLKKFLSLNDEQKEFVRYLTQSSRAFRFGLGNAGVGKSYALNACFYACKRQGLRLHVLAPTGKTADDLTKDTGVECQTLTKFLGDFLLPWSVQLRHHLRQFWRAAHRRKTWRFRQPHPPKLTSRDVIVVDEAGMVGTRQMRILAELVERTGCTLWLIGDPCQLPSVEGTPPLPTLAAKYGAAYLKKIRRQKKAWARKAARLFAEGHVVKALNLFLDHKQITVRDSMDELLQQVCWEWAEQGLHTPEQALIITNQNAIAHQVNQLCEELRLNAGCLRSSPSIRITDEQEEYVYESHAYCGSRVVCTQNTQPFPKGIGVKNGSRGTVIDIRSFTGEIIVLLDNKKLVKIPVRKYPHVRLAYAVTTFKSQSSDVPYVYAIVSGTNFPAAYVQSTRAIKRTLFYTTSNLLDANLENVASSRLAWQMSRRPDLRLASELLADAPLKLRRQKLRISRVRNHKRLRPELEPQKQPRKETHMITNHVPVTFWLVLVDRIDDEPVTYSCEQFTFDELLRSVMFFISPHNILGVYSDERDAQAHRKRLQDYAARHRVDMKTGVDAPLLESVGFPLRFWVVTKPTSAEQKDSLCLACNLRDLVRYSLAGLNQKDIFGIFGCEEAAIAATTLANNLDPHSAGIPLKNPSQPARFWIVTKPRPDSSLDEICFECSFAEYMHRVKGGLRPNQIFRAYAQKETAMHDANDLLRAVRQSTALPDSFNASESNSPPIPCKGFPQTFYCVLSPNDHSQLSDICIEWNLKHLAHYFLAPAHSLKNIVGIFAAKNTALRTATRLLEVLHPQTTTHAPADPSTAPSIASSLLDVVQQAQKEGAVPLFGETGVPMSSTPPQPNVATPVNATERENPKQNPVQRFLDKHWTRRFYHANDPNAGLPPDSHEKRPLLKRADSPSLTAYAPFSEPLSDNQASAIRSASPPSPSYGVTGIDSLTAKDLRSIFG